MSVKVANQWIRQILTLLYQAQRLTRSEIIEATGLNPASVSHALRYLVDSGVLLKTGDVQSSNRRRPEVFTLNSETGYFVAVDLEGDRIRFALTNFLGDVRYRWEEPLEFRQTLPPRKVIDGISKVLRELDETQAARVLAVGVSYPGLLDRDGRLTAVNLGWSGCPLVDVLKEAFSWPVFLERDKDTCVVAERWLGAAHGCNDALFLIADWGIGLGILADGRPFKGFRDFAGEIGHWKVIPDAEDVCNCGQKGCLEAIASSPNIIRQYLELAGNAVREPGKIRVMDVFERARQQDPAATAVLGRVAGALGLALSYAIGQFNPEIVILGGDIIAAENVLFPLIVEEIKQRTLPLSLADVKITVSGLGLDIRLKGAASLAFRSTLADPGLLRKMCSTEIPRRRRRYENFIDSLGASTGVTRA